LFRGSNNPLIEFKALEPGNLPQVSDGESPGLLGPPFSSMGLRNGWEVARKWPALHLLNLLAPQAVLVGIAVAGRGEGGIGPEVAAHGGGRLIIVKREVLGPFLSRTGRMTFTRPDPLIAIRAIDTLVTPRLHASSQQRKGRATNPVTIPGIQEVIDIKHLD